MDFGLPFVLRLLGGTVSGFALAGHHRSCLPIDALLGCFGCVPQYCFAWLSDGLAHLFGSLMVWHTCWYSGVLWCFAPALSGSGTFLHSRGRWYTLLVLVGASDSLRAFRRFLVTFTRSVVFGCFSSAFSMAMGTRVDAFGVLVRTSSALYGALAFFFFFGWNQA